MMTTRRAHKTMMQNVPGSLLLTYEGYRDQRLHETISFSGNVLEHACCGSYKLVRMSMVILYPPELLANPSFLSTKYNL